MKKLILMTAIAALSTSAFAATKTSKTTIKSKVKKAKAPIKFEVTLETETSTKRDKNFDIAGRDTIYRVEPGLKFRKYDTRVTFGAWYIDRQLGGTEAEKASKNNDGMSEIALKVNNNSFKMKDNGIGDFRLQTRIYRSVDDYFRKYYGSDGNYQFRTYFGRPIIGNWSLNKYVTYARYKKYITNDFTGDLSRDYELRLRLAPTYRLSKGTDLGVTTTYNHIFKISNTLDEEEIKVDLTFRKQVGPYAALVRVGTTVISNEEGTNSDLVINDDMGKDWGAALTLTAYL